MLPMRPHEKNIDRFPSRTESHHERQATVEIGDVRDSIEDILTSEG